MKANPSLPHPVVSNCETVAYPSVECFVKEREESAIVLEGRAEVLFCLFIRDSLTSLAHLPASDHQLSAIKNQLPQGSLSVHCLFSPCLYSFANVLVID